MQHKTHRALYRRYRPATFDELLGQDITVRLLREAARHNTLAHAYLFSGPRGTGKTTTSRLIAKIANCEKRATDARFAQAGEPCNTCSACVSIDEGRALDVIEIDAATNRGIDEIRNLKEIVNTEPAMLRNRVFIIDEAHQLTKEAFNALLKTLEEPPAHVIMILATTETEKIPATILSRVQQFFFKHAPLDVIVQKLKHIAKNEEIEITPEALALVATSAEGSFRDAESLLDQLIAFNQDDKKITLKEVESMIGKVGFDTLSGFVDFLLENKLPEALRRLSEIADEGHNLTQFAKDLIVYLRRVAVLKSSPAMEAVLARELMAEHIARIAAHAKLFRDSHMELLKSLIRAYSQMRYSQFPVIPLEVAVIEGLNK